MTQLLSTPKGNVNVRTATPDDAPGLFDLRMEALIAHPEAFAADVEITRARGVQAWSSLIINDTKDETGVIAVACHAEKLIGMSGVGRGHWPKTRHSGVVWGVYVQQTWRGLRIAELLLEECIQWASRLGIIVLKLGVLTTNLPAIRCYERAGFTVYGTDPKSNYLDGTYYDEYLMARMI